MFELPLRTWIGFFLWMAAGLVIYVLYGARHSKLRRMNERKSA
jgi:APA family basic amino acid/polyamine antiporter